VTWTSFLNTAKQCWNAERSEAIERHKVPLELLNAATRHSSTTSWCSSTSQCSVFKRCCASFKDLTSFDLQSRLCRFQQVTWTSFLNTAKQCWNAERSEAIERHKVPLELLNAAAQLSNSLSSIS
jgi:hypothetical protein